MNKRYLSDADVLALPEGAVIMTETNPETFGVYEQRVWQRFAGAADWQFGIPRHEWQSTDGGFVRVEDRDRDPLITINRRVTLLYDPRSSDPSAASAVEPIKVTVSDPATGEVLEERVIDNDFILLCAGNRYLDNVQAHANGTQVLTVKVNRG